MIPILFSRSINPKTIAGSNNMGIGRLNDCISAVVTEERNGFYELEIEYPINGEHFDDIVYNSWIKAKPYVNGDYQVFRVYRISKPINGVCVINAEHVSYMLTQAMVTFGTTYPDIAGVQLNAAINQIRDKIIDPRYAPNGTWGFTIVPLITSGAELFIMDKARSVREYLIGNDYSILTVYGDCDYLFDNFEVRITPTDPDDEYARGHDNGVRIQYGKNMSSLKAEESDDNVITHFYPYISIDIDNNSDNKRFTAMDLSEWNYDRLVANPLAASYQGTPKVLALNLKDFENWKNITYNSYYWIPDITEDDFYNCVNQYVAEHPESGMPHKSIDVSFVDLSKTDEYKNIIPLETINLCDIVTVDYPEWGISAKFKVVKTEYNVLEERYKNLTLGALQKTLN